MGRVTIKTYNGRIVGYIEDNGSERIAKSYNGAILGKYSYSTDTTRDYSGRVLSYGDITPALVWEKR